MASETSSAARRPRPLSPHLQIYKPQITSVLSILHRITGVVLSAGSLLLVAWLVVIAVGDDSAYRAFNAVVTGWFGLLLLFGWSAALFYHLLNGIRHLFWDAGCGFDLATTQTSGIAVLVGTAALTVIAWAAALILGLR